MEQHGAPSAPSLWDPRALQGGSAPVAPEHTAQGRCGSHRLCTDQGPCGFAHMCQLSLGSTYASQSRTHACSLPGLQAGFRHPAPLLPGAASHWEQDWDPLTIFLPALRHTCQLIMLLAQLPQLLPLLLQLVFQLQHPHLNDIMHAMVTLSPGSAPGFSSWHRAMLGWPPLSQTRYLPAIELKDHRGTSHRRSDGK